MLEGYGVYSLEEYEEEGKCWRKMKDFKAKKVGDMVVMATGSLQQHREWVDDRWDAYNSQRIEVDG
ncbi:hypothetical protein Pyn_33603 [Prunus yedoensis var. nudiflora]|uniref:Uncharacterized protein n=1 Tax=Prunus yedoensis var. nudiflora TaxID=2094558 RepID=A0A314XTP1_PRUYE|nr:hypothetical protein Pyn_33603 [Prunus yedoensis var. nudiflora]